MSSENVSLPEAVLRLQEAQPRPDILHVMRVFGDAPQERRRRGVVLWVGWVWGEAVGQGGVGGDVAPGGGRRVVMEVCQGRQEGVGGDGWVTPGAAVDVAVGGEIQLGIWGITVTVTGGLEGGFRRD